MFVMVVLRVALRVSAKEEQNIRLEEAHTIQGFPRMNYLRILGGREELSHSARCCSSLIVLTLEV
jgi:hypothetical protein